MKKIGSDKQQLILQAVKLTALGHELEYKRDKIKRMTECGIEPTMEMFRAIDDFNVTKMEYEKLEKEHLELRDRIIRGGIGSDNGK